MALAPTGAGTFRPPDPPPWAFTLPFRQGYDPSADRFVPGDADRLAAYNEHTHNGARQPPPSSSGSHASTTTSSDGLLLPGRYDEMPCTVQGCALCFSSTDEYETHFRSAHFHMCQQCRKVLPTDRLLRVHIAEVHDALFAVLAETQPMFECLVPGCESVSLSRRIRKAHLVDDHHYPANFRVGQFLGVPRVKQSHKVRPGHHGAASEDTAEGAVVGVAGEMELDGGSAVIDRRIPASISFGRRGRGGGRRGGRRGNGGRAGGGGGGPRVCFHCQEPGHVKRECPARAGGGARGGRGRGGAPPDAEPAGAMAVES
jgi:hypothetical protein